MQDTIIDNQAILIKTIGKIIKDYRIKKGKSIYKISAEVSMSKSTWREVELGLCRNINLTTLWKIAEGLEISLSLLIEDVKEKLGKDFSLSDLN